MTRESQPKAVADASQLLASALRVAVDVASSEALTTERSVWRCRLSGGPGLPESVIVRTSRELGGWRTEPMYLLNDYAAITFLSAHCPGITPRLIAADLDTGVYVTDDLGAGPSLADLLAGHDRAAAVDGLMAFAQSLGSMHAATSGAESDYYRRRSRLGPVDPAGHRSSLNEMPVPHAAERLLAGAAELGRPASEDVRAELRAMLTSLANPAEFLALSNGDPCPYNCLLPAGDKARFIDFELAGYRHALLDVAYLYLGFHCCYQPGRIPPAVLGDAEAAYRTAAGRGIPAMLDDRAYRRGLAETAAAWAVLAGASAVRQRAEGTSSALASARRSCSTVAAYEALCRQLALPTTIADWILEVANALVNGSAADPQALLPPFK